VSLREFAYRGSIINMRSRLHAEKNRFNLRNSSLNKSERMARAAKQVQTCNGEDAICYNLNVRPTDALLLQLLRIFKGNPVAIFVRDRGLAFELPINAKFWIVPRHSSL